MRAKSERSSFSSTAFSLILTFSVFVVLFHVFNFRFFMRDHMLHLFDLILSSTKRHNILFPITDCWQRSSFTFSGMITLVTRLKRSSLSSEKGFVKRLMQSTGCSMFFSWRLRTEVMASWCFPFFEDVPAISFACSASLANSGAIRIRLRHRAFSLLYLKIKWQNKHKQANRHTTNSLYLHRINCTHKT